MGERVDPTDESFRLFLARYINRGPVANSKIQIDNDIVTYLTEKDKKTHEFSALEFLARITPIFQTNGNQLIGINEINRLLNNLDIPAWTIPQTN
jgi:hypothetical protein